MSNYSETDFNEADDGLDYIFGYMGAIYGASFNRHWEGMDLGLVRQVWKEQLGKFLTYKPSMDYALGHLDPKFPPSAIAFKNLCNSGPAIPRKPIAMLGLDPISARNEEIRRAELDKIDKLFGLKRWGKYEESEN